MARTDGDWPSDRKPAPEREWVIEHGAEFWQDKHGRRHFRTVGDGERWFKAEHGTCELCDGTGFELYERGGYSFARRCERLAPLRDRMPAWGDPPKWNHREGGFTSAQDVSLPYREPGGDDE